MHKNGSLVDAACMSKAVRIRTRMDEDRRGHIMWPSIPRTTLFFSDNKVSCKENDLSEKGDIYDFQFFKAVKPNYG